MRCCTGIVVICVSCLLPWLGDSNAAEQNPGTNIAVNYTRKVFERYGNGERIAFEALEHLFEHLDIGNVSIPSHGLADHLTPDGEFVDLHEGEHSHAKENRTQLDVLVNPHDHANDHGHEHDNGDGHGHGSGETGRSDGHGNHPHSSANSDSDGQGTQRMHWGKSPHSSPNAKNSCLSPAHMLAILNKKSTESLNVSEFMLLCPAILYEIDSDRCRDHRLAHTHGRAPRVNATKVKGNVWAESIPLVWGSGMLAVFIISIVGLAGVAVVPVIQKKFYAEFLQFLVAMAIGALTGDAMLHLLPHALTGGHQHEESSGEASDGGHDTSGVWKGLVGLSGIFVFFIAERLMNIISAARSNRRNNADKEDSQSHTASEMVDLKRKQKQFDNEPEYSPRKGDDPEVFIRLNSDDSEKHAHGHGHGHSHGAPSSASSVASMVIMGDGLHNFSDGLAIGAAFASSMSMGVSTTIAVFCHELPHELGDFAMLLKTGMPVRLAIFYNLFSSILCFIGAAIGIVVGEDESASQWILLAIAGTFIYIALVDMLPEMAISVSLPVRRQLTTLLIQMSGILLGAGFMLTIAIFEDQIKLE